MPSSSAVFGLISTQVFHMTVVVGSANSCSQGMFAPASPRVGETYGLKKNSPLPAYWVGPNSNPLPSASAAVGAWSCWLFLHQPPYCWKEAVKKLISSVAKEPSV